MSYQHLDPSLVTGCGEPVTLDVDLLLGGHPQEIDPTEVLFYKSRWSAFHRTEPESWQSDHVRPGRELQPAELP